MIHEKLYNNYQTVNDNDGQFIFKGLLSQSTLVGLAETIRMKLSEEKQAKKIFAVFIELAQNIERYSAVRQKDERDKTPSGVGIILIYKNDDSFDIGSGNMIENERCGKIKSKIEFINSLNNDELKIFYRECRKGEPEAESKGAGIGLIEIARKAGFGLDSRIIKIDDKYSFLTISVKIKEEK